MLPGKKVIESGWGERHPLGSLPLLKNIFGWTLPSEYILLYAPRNNEEIQMAVDVMEAAIRFMTRDVTG